MVARGIRRCRRDGRGFLWLDALGCGQFFLEAKRFQKLWPVCDLLSVHVERTHGQWPESWEELAADSPSPRFADWKWPSNRQQIEARIHVDFSLTCGPDVAREWTPETRAVEREIGPSFYPPEIPIYELLATCRKYRREIVVANGCEKSLLPALSHLIERRLRTSAISWNPSNPQNEPLLW